MGCAAIEPATSGFRFPAGQSGKVEQISYPEIGAIRLHLKRLALERETLERTIDAAMGRKLR